MKNVKIYVAMFCSFVAAVFSGCKGGNFNSVLGDWNLTGYYIEENAADFLEASISFATEGKTLKVSGFSGVNLFSGSCKVNGNKFSSGAGIVTTKMAGSKDDMEFERAFLKTLEGADKIAVESENEKQVLRISNSEEKSSLVFKRASIKDSEWILTSILKGDGVLSVNVDEESLPTLSFSADGKATGFSGVNYYTMDYSLDENAKKLSFTLGASTLMASGSNEAQELERQFYINIDKASTYSLSGNNLTIRSSDRKILLEFIKKSEN